METYKYIILGAGPAGLSFANALQDAGEENFVVCEKEQEAGGLCRSRIVDGAPLDIGGGHFLDVRRPKVNEFLFRFMPESEWNLFDRDSRIEVEGVMVGHPLEANIWQMPKEMQIEYLLSIAHAGCNTGKPQPPQFTDWIRWKLGDRIADSYMLPYNSKMFGAQLDNLGTYWLNKLPDVSFDEVLRSCFDHRAYGTQPGHAQFYYPRKYGYGELWLRMADAIAPHMRYGNVVEKIDLLQKEVHLSDGSRYRGEHVIVTIPWTSVREFAGMPEELEGELRTLRHTSVNITYMPDTLDTKAQWIYYPDPKLSYHRILVRSNFCPGAAGYWTETNSERYTEDGSITFYNEYMYPLNTQSKPDTMKRLLEWCRKRGVLGLGRWGEWEHYNSDATVERALELAGGMR